MSSQLIALAPLIFAVYNVAHYAIMGRDACSATRSRLTSTHPLSRPARLMVHDTQPGGIGLCHAALYAVSDVVQTALAFVAECRCTTGCPQCIHDFRCEEYNVRLDKAAALEILQVSVLNDPKSFSFRETRDLL